MSTSNEEIEAESAYFKLKLDYKIPYLDILSKEKQSILNDYFEKNGNRLGSKSYVLDSKKGLYSLDS